ncbi:hypothetical protein [Streptomyces sp. Tue6028]|uniref:hypothetical protein n=1 Tax=Streptomyces sp. Tue6028 TaxID=2036037 RepID=UPI003EBBDC83
MALRKHTDLSNVEPGQRAEPVIMPMETMGIEVGPKRVRFLAAMHRNSILGTGAVVLLVLAAVFGCAVATGMLAAKVGVGPEGCMIATGVAAAVAIGLVVFVFQQPVPTTDVGPAPETRPPVHRPDKKRKKSKNRKKGKNRK